MTSYLSHYQSFKTVEEMEMHVENHRFAHYGKMNETYRGLAMRRVNQRGRLGEL